jgi:HTH-type transcriptional regulator/antitoxin HigA
MSLQNLDVDRTVSAWAFLADTVFVPHSLEEYRRLVALLDTLVDEVGEDEKHPLASLMEIVGVLVQNYENENVPELTAS